MSQETNAFGKWRSILWPVHNYELKKLLPMVLLFFFILFNYTILRDTKDTLVVTAPGSGAEVIPFLKFWGVLPAAVIFTLVYAKLSNKLSKPTLFYSVVGFFIAFFVVFTMVLYPARNVIHPHAFCDTMQEALPAGFMGLIGIVRNWSYSLFYIMAELWGSTALSLLFWGFANDITRVNEAKRFYSLFGLFGNFALPISGQLIKYCSKMRDVVPEGVDGWHVTLMLLTSLVALAGALIIGLYWYMNRYVLTDARFYDPSELKASKKKKPKMSIKESFAYLARSKYIGCIAVLVLAYGISINLVEVTWKSQLKLQYPNPSDYSMFMGNFSTFTGIATIFMMLFVGGNVMRKLGWGIAAMITPVMLLITGSLFFTFIIFRESLGPSIAAIGTTPLMLAVVFGTIQNVASKSTKYSLFDPTKESAYIPLDQESKVKGKAAVDVVGARLGKSGGALVQQGLIILFGSLSAITPIIAVILFLVIGSWIVAVRSLNVQFNDLITQKEEEAKAATAAEGEPALKTRTQEAPQAT